MPQQSRFVSAEPDCRPRAGDQRGRLDRIDRPRRLILTRCDRPSGLTRPCNKIIYHEDGPLMDLRNRAPGPCRSGTATGR